MDSFEFEVKKGLYKINDEIIIRKSDPNKFSVYLIDYKNKIIYTSEVIKDFNLNSSEDIYLYEYILFKALASDYKEEHFVSLDELKTIVKIDLLNEFSEADFCHSAKHKDAYQRFNSVVNFIKGNMYDILKFVCILSIISIFNYFVNNKAILMLNSIYGESMKPTLKTYSAGVVIYPSHLDYGDLVACRKMVDGENMNFLKRIIALPGDHVEIINDYVYVNGTLVSEPYIKSAYRTSSNQRYTFEDIWKKTVINNNEQFQTNNAPKTIPANYYFVLGDNRKDSYDSRYFGLVHFDEIVGEYIFTLISL